jgi:hypothetical protein
MKFRSSISSGNQAALLFMLIFIICTVTAAATKDFWEKKEYKEWSEKDCRKMLEDSPWAKIYEVRSTGYIPLTTSDVQHPFIRYQVQFRSALPVREAIVRQTQIENNYDDLSAKQQKTDDKQTDPFLNANYDNYVVVYVSYTTNHRNVLTELNNHWEIQNADKLKFSVYLTGEKGVKIELAQYAYYEGVGAFQFVFPRKKDSQEVIGPEDKYLTVEFPYPGVGATKPQGLNVERPFRKGTAFVEFKTKNMTYNDKLEY